MMGIASKHFFSRCSFALGSLLICCIAPEAAVAANKVALVLGNSEYQQALLSNPENDAVDMAETLRKLGFEVLLKTNVDRREMRQAIRDFGDKLKRSRVGLFYFAGHGIQIKGVNYLVPVSADVQSADEVQDESIDANAVLRKMESAGNDVNIVILDACRNNPFARSFRSANSGLARMEGPVGSLIAYATAPGSVASDGAGRNGLYTKHLLRALKQPGITIEQTFKIVRNGVREDTEGKQVPWESSSLTGEFSFMPGIVQQAVVVPKVSVPHDLTRGHLQIITNVPQANISINNQHRGLVDQDGVLSIPNLVEPEVEVQISAEGYQQQNKKVKLTPGEWQKLTVELQTVVQNSASTTTEIKALNRDKPCLKGKKILLTVQTEFHPLNAAVKRKNHNPQLHALVVKALQRQQLLVENEVHGKWDSTAKVDFTALAKRVNARFIFNVFVEVKELPISAVKTRMKTIQGDITLNLVEASTGNILSVNTQSFQKAGLAMKQIIKQTMRKNINIVVQDMLKESCQQVAKAPKKGFLYRLKKLFSD